MISFLIASILLNLAIAAPDQKWVTRFPHGILTPDYGILNEEDFYYDSIRRDSPPYDPARLGHGVYWQCFQVKDVRHYYHVWVADDPLGRSGHPVKLCDLSTWARRDGEIHDYYGNRAHPISYCRQYVREWKRLVRNQTHVCFNGETVLKGDDVENGIPRKNVMQWSWDKFKTRRGCYSNFEEDCTMAGWKQDGSPRDPVVAAEREKKRIERAISEAREPAT